MLMKRNTLWNIAGMGAYPAGCQLLIPLLLRRLGNEAFGVVAMIWTLSGYVKCMAS